MAKRTRQPKQKQSTATVPASIAVQPSGEGGEGDPITTPLARLTRYQRFQTVTVHRRQLTKAPYNPRQMSPAGRKRLQKGIQDPRIGLVEPIVWNARTGNIVGGKHRIESIDDLEGTDDYQITVSRIDVDETTERQINVLLNNPAAQGQYDLILLEQVMTEIHEAGGDLRDTGFSSVDMAAMFSDEFVATVLGQTGVADQQAAERSTVEALAEIRTVADQVQKAEKQNDDKTDKTPAGVISSTTEEPEKREHREGTEGQPDNLFGDGGDEGETGTGSGGNKTEEAETDREALKRRRSEFTTAANVRDSADTILTLVFDRPDQIPRFLSAVGLDAGLRFVDAVEFAAAVGVVL